jgi:hypothetical protein
MTEGFVCSDIELIVTEAARATLDQNKPSIDQETLELKILESVPSVSGEDLVSFQRFAVFER